MGFFVTFRSFAPWRDKLVRYCSGKRAGLVHGLPLSDACVGVCPGYRDKLLSLVEHLLLQFLLQLLLSCCCHCIVVIIVVIVITGATIVVTIVVVTTGAINVVILFVTCVWDPLEPAAPQQ